MHHEIKLRRIVGACLVAAGVSGCTTMQRANVEVMTTKRTVAEAQRRAEHESTPTVSSTSASWLLGGTVVVTTPLSPILAQTIEYGSNKKVTLADVASYLTQNYGLPVDISDLTGTNGLASQGSGLPVGPVPLPRAGGGLPLPPAGLMSALSSSSTPSLAPMVLSYSGTISGLLDVVAEKEGVWWEFEDGRVRFYRTMTKTIYMPAISRHTKIASMIIANGGPSTGTSTGQITGGSSSGGSSGSTGSSTISSDYQVDIWKAIQNTAKVVAGGSGPGAALVVASASLGGVTVTGTPTQVHHVEEWARALSDNLSQMVKVTVRLYSVTLNNEDNYSWNPDIAFQKLGSIYGLSLTGPTIPAVSGSVSPMAFGAKIVSGTNAFNNSTAVYKALSTLGKVSEVKAWSMLAMNGQVGNVQLANQVTYAAQSGATATANVGTTSTLTPGVVTTGLTGTIQPRIVNGKITLAMDLTDSVLNGITTFSSGGATIQEPSISVSALPSSISLTPGTELLATGISERSGSVTQNGTFVPTNPLLGGGTDAGTGQTLIAVEISAEVM